MAKNLLALLFLCLITGNAWAQTDSIAPQLNDSLLIEYLRNNYYPSNPKNYDPARDYMYQTLDVDATDSLTGVYTGLRAKADGTRTPSNGDLSFNTEHSWPQSFYNENEPMRGDIHHLYPVWSSANSSRNNNPFAEIDDNLTTSWWYWKNGSKLTSVPTADIDEYSEYYNSSFEPRESHKGNAARSMFYFWALYQTNTNIINDEYDNQAFFDGMKETLYQWHKQDPVDAAELARSLAIESFQGNRNPFIHDTSLVRRSFFYEGEVISPPSSDLPDVYISEVYEANGGTVKYLELFNTTNNTIDFTTNNWELRRYSNSNSSFISVSLSGSIEPKKFFVIGDDNSNSGVQTIFGEGVVDQSTSVVNHNGNEKYLLLRTVSGVVDTVDSFGIDNIGNASDFAKDQVAYRLYSELPNNGSFGQQSISSNGDTVASGNWVVFDVTSANANARYVATPGYSKGLESSLKSEVMITGAAGWRLLSIPANNANLAMISDDMAIQGVGNGSTPNVFTFNNSGLYQTPASLSSSLQNGTGLVVYFFNNATNGSKELPIVIDLEDEAEPTSDVNVSLNSTNLNISTYLTLVGNPFQSNFDGSFITTDNSIQANVHFLENGLYFTQPLSTTTLLPWQGFWVESSATNTSTQLTFPLTGKTQTAATVSSFSKGVAQEFDISLNLKSDKSFDRGCVVSFKQNANSGWDRYDASKLSPSVDQYAILGCIEEGKIKSVTSYSSDLEEEIEIPLYLESVNVDEALSLSWGISENLPNGWDVFLRDNVTNEEFSLLDESEYNFLNETTSRKIVTYVPKLDLKEAQLKAQVQERFTLFVSPNKLASSIGHEEEHPTSFSLDQNYPNPFNPATTLSYTLKSNTFVRLSVYSITGQEVATLVNSSETVGKKSVIWNASNLSSGVYYARLQVAGEAKTIKMTLLK